MPTLNGVVKGDSQATSKLGVGLYSRRAGRGTPCCDDAKLKTISPRTYGPNGGSKFRTFAIVILELVSREWR